MPADTDALALLEKLEDFFGGPDLTTAISDFAAAHGAEFHPLPEGAEHPLQWHSRYLEYCGMIERQLEGFLQQHGCTSERLYAACREGDASHTCIEYLLASTEYLAFLQLMLDFQGLSSYEIDEDDPLGLNVDLGGGRFAAPLGGALDGPLEPEPAAVS